MVKRIGVPLRQFAGEELQVFSPLSDCQLGRDAPVVVSRKLASDRTVPENCQKHQCEVFHHSPGCVRIAVMRAVSRGVIRTRPQFLGDLVIDSIAMPRQDGGMPVPAMIGSGSTG